jgi:hypothetical protein
MKHQRSNNHSMVMDKLNCGGAVQEAFFAVQAYPRCELGRFKSLITLKIEAVCSSRMSVLSKATQCNISKDTHHDTT